MNNEYADSDGYEGWLPQQPLTTSELGKKFVALRNVSVKVRSVGAQHSEIRFDFGPEGLQGKGTVTVLGPAITVGEPVLEYVTVKDDDGERQVKVTVTQDFVVEETYNSGKKSVSSSNFLAEARECLDGLEQLVDECERRFGSGRS